MNTSLYHKELINNLFNDLSKSLNTDINKLTPLLEKLNIIINNNTLTQILETYFSLLEEEMITINTKKITPSLQFGIKNHYFTFIGYNGKISSTIGSNDITNKTYYSFDSISKVLTSMVTMLILQDKKISLDSTINSYNQAFNMNATINSILKFTALIQTEKRIDNLSIHETLKILKKCRENLDEKKLYKNYYQYNDIGFMILRLSLPNFIEYLNYLLQTIDKSNLTYKNHEHKDITTGGKIGLEYVTPDPKGRGIIFPGHTGLYGNIEGLLNLYDKILNYQIISKDNLNLLLEQPYTDPLLYTKEGYKKTNKNGNNLYTTKVAGFYRMPKNIIDPNYSKLSSCDFSNLTTNNALASAGTCGSWVMGDNLSYQNKFGTYVGGILTNPYSYINISPYPENINEIKNTNLLVNQKGVIYNYPSKLNYYKEIITEYGLILEVLTEYLKQTPFNKELENNHITYTKKLKRQ